MNYVKSFDLLGTEAKQIPSITDKGAPTNTTEGAVGCLYMDTTNGDLYKCINVSDGVYTWCKINGDTKLEIQSDEDLETLRDFKSGIMVVTANKDNWDDFISSAESNNGDFGVYMSHASTSGINELYKNILVYSGKYSCNYTSQPGIAGETNQYIQYFIDGNIIYKRVIELAENSDAFGSYVSFERIENATNIEIDQTYSPTSENAQSGKAVAEAVADKLDKDKVIIVEKSQSINVFNPNAVVSKKVNNIVFYISEVIPCTVGDIVYVKIKNDDDKIIRQSYGLWLIGTNGSEVFVSDNRLLEYTIEKHPNISELLGVKIGILSSKVPLENLNNIMVTINADPTNFEPYGEEIIKNETNLIEKSIKCISQTLTEEEKEQARTNIGAIGEGEISSKSTYSKVLVMGDSISTDYYGNYTKWVTVLKNEGFFPENTINDSIHATGFVARYNNEENDFISRIEAVTDKDTYDLVVVFGGINDFLSGNGIPMGESGGDRTTEFNPQLIISLIIL